MKNLEQAFFIDKEHYFSAFPKRFEIAKAKNNDRVFPKNIINPECEKNS
jgi:hypothetical protein